MPSDLNPATDHREFLGVAGAAVTTLTLPVFVVLLYLVTNENYCIDGLSLDINAVREQLPHTASQWARLVFHKRAWQFYLVWYFAVLFADLVLVGKHVKGTKLRDGTRLDYNINGRAVYGAFVALVVARFLLVPSRYLPELHFLYTHHLQLILVTIVFSSTQAVLVYLMSFIPLSKPNGAGTRERILSVNGNSGNMLYDFFLGRELNPRIGPWDIKLFSEVRPGLLLWILVNVACIHHQYHKFGRISDSILLVSALQAAYVLDVNCNEEGSLTMMDITTDGFGFMLCFGDLAWLPWTYSLQARVLSVAHREVHLGPLGLTLITLLCALGYYIYHASNSQKSEFRNGRLEHMASINTKTGTKLLCDGWWKRARHINYLGDLLIAVSWCLATGLQTPVTYFYVVYVSTLLIHRQRRDDAKCARKYGLLWELYTRQVPYRIIPYVY